MKAIPLSGVILEKNCSKAFKPPAEAPIPTMRKRFSLLSRGRELFRLERTFRRFFAAGRARFLFETTHSPAKFTSPRRLFLNAARKLDDRRR
jgi:hypothetical protein